VAGVVGDLLAELDDSGPLVGVGLGAGWFFLPILFPEKAIFSLDFFKSLHGFTN
jgi:ABC-type polysaccharide/polyol phosphate export permease